MYCTLDRHLFCIGNCAKSGCIYWILQFKQWRINEKLAYNKHINVCNVCKGAAIHCHHKYLGITSVNVLYG